MPVNNCCCSGHGPGTLYRRARICSGGALGGVWMTTTDASIVLSNGGAFTVEPGNMICYDFDLSDPTYSSPGGPLYTAGVAASYANCSACNGITNACECTCTEIDFSYHADGGRLVLDGGTGLYYRVGSGTAGLQWLGNNGICSAFTKTSGQWVLPTGLPGKSFRSTLARCPPTVLAGWNGTSDSGLYLENVSCKDDAVQPSDLPDVLNLVGLLGNMYVSPSSYWSYYDPAAPIWDGTLHRISGYSYGTGTLASYVNVAMVGGGYQTLYITLDAPTGQNPTIGLSNPYSASDYALAAWGILGNYGNTGNKYFTDVDTLDTLLPLTLEVTV